MRPSHFLLTLCAGCLISCSGGGGSSESSGGGGGAIPMPSSLTLGTSTNPAGIATSTPRFAFVSNEDASTSLYTVNPSTGQLRANGYISPGTTNTNAPGQVVVHPNGRYVYIPNIGENTVSAYEMGTNGFLTPLSGSPVPSGNGPAAAAITSNGNFLYVANVLDNTISGYTVNAASGALAALGSSTTTGAFPFAMTIDPSGRFLYVTNAGDNTVSAFSITPGTGALTPVPGSPAGTGLIPVAARVDSKGRLLLVANYDEGTVTSFAVNAATGALSGAVAIPVGANPSDIATDLTGKFIYIANDGDNTISAFAVDPTGLLSTIPGSPFAIDGGPVGLSVDPSGQFLYVATEGTNAVTGYAINSTTGALARRSTIHTRSTPAILTMSGGSSAVAYTPTFAYVANEGSNNVSAYAVNATTGALTEVSGSPFASDDGPRSITVDRTGRFVYTANGGYANAPALAGHPHVSGFIANPNTGSLAALSPVVTPFLTLIGIPTVITADVSGQSLYLTTNNTQSVVTYSIDPVTGVLIDRSGNAGCGNSLYNSTSAFGLDPIGRGGYRANKEPNSLCIQTVMYPLLGVMSSIGLPDVPTGGSPSAVAVDPTGRYVYVANQMDNTISSYRRAPVDGTLTLVGTISSGGTSPNSLAVEPTARFIYATNETSNTASVFRMDDATGALTSLGSVATGLTPRSVAIDTSGKFAYVTNRGANTISVYSINLASGLLTPQGTVASGVNPVSIAIASTIQ